jgi:hypothetical protein
MLCFGLGRYGPALGAAQLAAHQASTLIDMDGFAARARIELTATSRRRARKFPAPDPEAARV